MTVISYGASIDNENNGVKSIKTGENQSRLATTEFLERCQIHPSATVVRLETDFFLEAI